MRLEKVKNIKHNGRRKASFQCGLRIVRESPEGLSKRRLTPTVSEKTQGILTNGLVYEK